MLLSTLPSFEQRNFIYSFLNLVSRHYLSSIVTSEDDSRWWQSDAEIVSAASGLIKLILSTDEPRKSHMITWLTSSSGAGVGDGISIRRAVIAALATEKNDIETILDQSLRQFGDQLYIRHTPTMQQEGILFLIIENIRVLSIIQYMLKSSFYRQATSLESHHFV
jgi:telomere length regulation protein